MVVRLGEKKLWLTLKLMRGDAPGSSVPLATYSATTEKGYRYETDPSIFTLGRFT